jgi:hypothetical protein
MDRAKTELSPAVKEFKNAITSTAIELSNEGLSRET